MPAPAGSTPRPDRRSRAEAEAAAEAVVAERRREEEVVVVVAERRRAGRRRRRCHRRSRRRWARRRSRRRWSVIGAVVATISAAVGDDAAVQIAALRAAVAHSGAAIDAVAAADAVSTAVAIAGDAAVVLVGEAAGVEQPATARRGRGEGDQTQEQHDGSRGAEDVAKGRTPPVCSMVGDPVESETSRSPHALHHLRPRPTTSCRVNAIRSGSHSIGSAREVAIHPSEGTYATRTQFLASA